MGLAIPLWQITAESTRFEVAISSLDTSLIVRVIVNDDPRKRLQVLELLSEENHIFHIFTPALMETVYVLEKVYELPRADIANKLAFFLERFSDNLVYDNHLTRIAFPMYLQHPQLSFGDCLLSACAEVGNAEPLYTYDKDLAKKSPSAKLLG